MKYSIEFFFGFQSPCDGVQDLFSSRFEPQILAAMSRHVALFPPAGPDNSYPPQWHKASLSSSASNNSRSSFTLHKNWWNKSNSLSRKKAAPGTDSLSANGNESLTLNTKDAIFGKSRTKTLQRYPTTRYALNTVDFMPQSGTHTKLCPSQLPLSNETLASISTFCFPGNVVRLLLPDYNMHYCCNKFVLELN